MNSSFNKEGPIKYMIEVNIYYQEHRERMEINVIEGQKQSVILGMPWLTHHNPEIDWKTGEVKITRCPEECGKQQRPKQGKAGQQKQKEEKKEEEEKKQEEKETEKKQKKKKQKGEKTINVKRVAEEWKIWDKKGEAEKLEEETKMLVPKRFHKWIKVFDKKQSERMPTRKT